VSECLWVCVWERVCVSVCLRERVCEYVCMSVCFRACVCGCVFVSVSVWVWVCECVLVCVCVWVRVCECVFGSYIYTYIIHTHTSFKANSHMGWLRLVGSLEWYVSFAEYSLFYMALLQKSLIKEAIYTYIIHTHTSFKANSDMGWLRLVGSLK